MWDENGVGLKYLVKVALNSNNNSNKMEIKRKVECRDKEQAVRLGFPSKQIMSG